jgi:integrase
MEKTAAKNTANKKVTDQKIRGLNIGQTCTESLSGRGSGSIFFKKDVLSTSAFYRYYVDKKSRMIFIGHHKRTAGAVGMTLAEIREKAAELATIFLKSGDPKILLASIEAEKKAEADKAERLRIEDEKIGTFEDLLDAYVADMHRRKAVKAGEVQRLFLKHIKNDNPDFLSTYAKDISAEDVHAMLRKVLKKTPAGRGIGNLASAQKSDMASTTDSLRRYLKAAFNFPIKNRLSLDSDIADSKTFSLEINPVEKIITQSGVTGGNTESLEQKELGEFLRHLDTFHERDAAICRAAIYLGGQRMQQLFSLPWDRTFPDYLHLYETKGKKNKRVFDHYLPVTPRISEILRPLLENRIGPGLFCLGNSFVRPDVAGKIFRRAGKELSESGKTGYFSYRELRATCETLMGGIGIPAETRAWILSHGRTTIADVHYDRNTYMTEKTEGLTLWGDYLDCLYSMEKWQGQESVFIKNK